MRVGIAGTGSMGATHAAAWSKTKATIAGFVSKDIPVAEKLAEQYAAVLYPDLQTMLAAVDVVDICTPTHLHCEMVLAAAAAGKDIICEKPLARTLEQGQQMIAACDGGRRETDGGARGALLPRICTGARRRSDRASLASRPSCALRAAPSSPRKRSTTGLLTARNPAA